MNKVILVGENYYNILGLARSFGTNGVKPYGVIIGGNKQCFVAKSKHWKEVFYIDNIVELVPFLLTHFSLEKRKPVIVCGTDMVAKAIDMHYNLLADNFYCATIGEKQGRILDYMNKQQQSLLFRDMELKAITTTTVFLKNATEQFFDYPIIAKPKLSAEGKKSDICICRNKIEWNSAVNEFLEKEYSQIIVQPYMEKRREFVIVGAISGNLLSYSLLHNIRQWPSGCGTGCYSEFVNDMHIHEFAKVVLHKLIQFGYSGPIDIEFFMDSNGEFYMNEINWRSSGRNFVSQYTNVHSVFLWYLDISGQTNEYVEKINEKEGRVMTETADIKNVLAHNISFTQWIKQFRNSDCYALHDQRDLKPELSRIMYFLCKKLAIK